MSIGEKNKMSQFDKYVNLIRKYAHHYAEHTKYASYVEYEDVEAQGFLIYCEALESYDITKGSFSTHLCTQLGRLDHYCYNVARHGERKFYENECDEGSYDSMENMSADALPSRDNFLEMGRICLSSMAYKVFEWILGRSWETKSRHKATIMDASKAFNVSYREMRKIWGEIEDFYKRELISNVSFV